MTFFPCETVVVLLNSPPEREWKTRLVYLFDAIGTQRFRIRKNNFPDSMELIPSNQSTAAGGERAMSPTGFTDVLEQARVTLNEVCDKATLVLKRALPDIEGLQRGDIYSPRLMGLMCARTEGKLPEPDRQLLASALQYVEEFQLIHVGWVLSLKNSDQCLDASAASVKCGEAIGALHRMLAELDGVLAKTGRP
jgi:hypothetical protein